MENEIERLKEENERLNRELRREHEMYIRGLADFDDYRRRVERERAQAARAGKRELTQSLLEVMNDFNRALLRANDDPQSALADLRLVYNRLAFALGAQVTSAFSGHDDRANPARPEVASPAESERAAR